MTSFLLVEGSIGVPVSLGKKESLFRLLRLHEVLSNAPRLSPVPELRGRRGKRLAVSDAAEQPAEEIRSGHDAAILSPEEHDVAVYRVPGRGSSVR